MSATAVSSVISVAPSLQNQDPEKIMAFALQNYSPNIGIAFSGAEDVVLIDLAAKTDYPFRVFCLDTGRLHAETYDFLERVRQHYGIQMDIFSPQPQNLQRLVLEKGLFSFYRDGHQECCGIRKVEPLRRALSLLDAWVTGQRPDQSPSTRGQLSVVQIDSTFSTQQHSVVKFNPLVNWTSAEIWRYIRENGVPYNSLHERGFSSIGCQPCTRPTLPGQHEREGRWWWEEETKKECGLHIGKTPNTGEVE